MNRLLVLDDDDPVAQTIAAIAQAHGLETRTTSNPAVFFEAVDAAWPTHIAIDLVMPGMDGVEVLRSLAQRGCPASIIVTSGLGTKVLEAASKSGMERGLSIAGILPKPFSAQTLRDLLNNVVQEQPGAKPALRGQPRQPSLTAQDIAAGLQQDEFVVHFQPKINIATGRAVGFEALVRWQHPEFGLLAPDLFIALAEQNDAIAQLTHRVVERALEWFSACCLDESLSLAVNLSARNLTEIDLADRLACLCGRFRVAPARVNLELTETAAMTNVAVAFDVLSRLRIKGFTLGIDDFGTGYSSMVQLARLPFTQIKIDKSFVMTMVESEQSRKIVDSIIQLAKGLGLTSVAEGVEAADALQLLAEMGCDLAQGYHFARPMDAVSAYHWLRDWQAAHPAT